MPACVFFSCAADSAFFFFFFFNDTATTEIYTLSLHDALPISRRRRRRVRAGLLPARGGGGARRLARSEEHTSELQSLAYLVCRLLLEKKKQYHTNERVGKPPHASRLLPVELAVNALRPHDAPS